MICSTIQPRSSRFPLPSLLHRLLLNGGGRLKEKRVLRRHFPKYDARDGRFSTPGGVNFGTVWI